MYPAQVVSQSGYYFSAKRLKLLRGHLEIILEVPDGMYAVPTFLQIGRIL
jgi:hypothetical protein